MARSRKKRKAAKERRGPGRQPSDRGLAKRPSPSPRQAGSLWQRLERLLDGAAAAMAHPQAPQEPVWKHLWSVLALAFAVRAAVALSGDFIVSPDEIMQYLEQGHRLAFGNGVIYWEFFYGTRSWLTPGLIAGVLMLFDAFGVGQPHWYIQGVELAFCAFSLLIPAGMYFFSRQHFGEGSARAALLAGALWYELIGFAHKPMTEFTVTVLLMALMALCLRPSPSRPRVVWTAALVGALAMLIRLQYAPLALGLLGLLFLRIGKGAKAQLALAAALFLLAGGFLDGMSWDGGPFHSWRKYLAFHLAADRAALEPAKFQFSAFQHFQWLLFTGGGLAALGAALALREPRRYGLLFMLIALVMVPHAMEQHKEYRNIFAVVPLWLLLGADATVRLAGRMGRPAWICGAAGALFAVVSLAGIFNALPRQDESCCATVHPPFRFIRGQDPAFAAYLHLASAPGVKAVWHLDRDYASTPGYYYLHRRIPFYDRRSGLANNLPQLDVLQASVSHLVTEDSGLEVPGYVLDMAFGNLRVLRREDNASAVRQWRAFTPTIADLWGAPLMRRLYPEAPLQPDNLGIEFATTGQPGT